MNFVIGIWLIFGAPTSIHGQELPPGTTTNIRLKSEIEAAHAKVILAHESRSVKTQPATPKTRTPAEKQAAIAYLEKIKATHESRTVKTQPATPKTRTPAEKQAAIARLEAIKADHLKNIEKAEKGKKK